MLVWHRSSAVPGTGLNISHKHPGDILKAAFVLDVGIVNSALLLGSRSREEVRPEKGRQSWRM